MELFAARSATERSLVECGPLVSKPGACAKIRSMISLQHWWFGILSYSACHLLHIFLWRSLTIKHDVRAIFLCLFFSAFVFLLFPAFSLCAFLVHAILAATYIALYPTFQASSPSIVIMSSIHASAAGLNAKEILMVLGHGNLMSDRFRDLVIAKLLTKNGEHYALTARGKRLADLFIFYRQFLGLPRGGG